MTHSIAAHVTALQSVLDQAGDVSGLLKAIERCEGRDIAEAAYNALCAQLPSLQLAPYKLFEDGRIGERKGSIYRFYCYRSSWHISPAARAGYVLEGV